MYGFPPINIKAGSSVLNSWQFWLPSRPKLNALHDASSAHSLAQASNVATGFWVSPILVSFVPLENSYTR